MRAGDSTAEPGTQGFRNSGLSAFPGYFFLLARLTKLPIAVLSAISAVTGYLVFGRVWNSGVITTFVGVLLLAMGACALNEFQDRDIDARMPRTRRRPIPSGELRPAAALALVALLLPGGALILWHFHNPAAAWVGVAAVACYNGVYTWLKRISAIAVLPGALVGAMPPVLGWTAAGGSPSDPRVLALAFFFYLWQIPHFWLLLLVHRDEYEYANLPILTKWFSLRQLAGITFTWTAVASASSLLLPLYLLTASSWVIFGLACAGLWVSWQASRLLRTAPSPSYFLPMFRTINVYALLVMALLIADSIL